MKTTNIIVAALAAFTVSALPSASAAAGEQTVLKFDAGSSDVRAVALAGACTINIMQVNDQRFTKDGVGVDSSIPTDPPQTWIANSLDSLAAYGFTVQHSATPVPTAVNVNVNLIRAYTWFGNMRINGMVAVDVTFPARPDAPVEKFRSAGSKSNMMGANSEHVTALNYAANHMVSKLAPALLKHCKDAKLASK